MIHILFQIKKIFFQENVLKMLSAKCQPMFWEMCLTAFHSALSRMAHQLTIIDFQHDPHH